MTTEDFVFVGVTTSSSAVTQIFSDWCSILRVDWRLQLVDIPIGADAVRFSALVDELRSDRVAGSLITSHKAALFEQCWSQFDLLEPECFGLREIGVVYRREGRLCGGVGDIRSCGLAMAEILTEGQVASPPEAVILGAGGAGLAAAWNLAVLGETVERVTIVEADQARRHLVADLVLTWPRRASVRVVGTTTESGLADDTVRSAKPGSLIVNATGMGKDRVGSPVKDAGSFPANAIVWDFNYRGSLDFLEVARQTSRESDLHLHDGWDYFTAGWAVVMSKVAGEPWSDDVLVAFREAASRVFNK